MSDETLTWFGRDIRTMSRDELEQAFRELAERYRQAQAESHAAVIAQAKLMRDLVADRTTGL